MPSFASADRKSCCCSSRSRASPLVRRTERARQLEDLLPPALRLQHLVHQAERRRLLEGHVVAAHHELDRLRLPDQARQALSAPRPGKDPERDLGKADLAPAL